MPEPCGEPEPRTIARYEIQGVLGRGMMGVVYDALDPLLGRRIALKTIQTAFPLSAGEKEAFEKRFLAEARIAAVLSHPGIVTVHDLGRDAGTGLLYIALERLEGQTLTRVIENEAPVEWRRALRIVRRLAEALGHAHSQGIVHRDVKPGNVMVLAGGDPKIMDFGIAKVATADPTAAGHFFGTPLFMSPEQADGRAVDGRSDLFSLGTIAYALLTGRVPFEAENVARVLHRVLHEDPPPPSEAVPSLPAGIDAMLARLLAKDRALRYAGAEELVEDIDEALAGRSPRHGLGSSGSVSAPHGDPRAAAPARPVEDVPTIDLDAELARLVEAPPPAQRPAPRGAPPRRPVSRKAWGLGLALLAAAAAIGLAGLQRLGVFGTEASAPPAVLVEPARLQLVLEHSVKSGRVRIWVDRERVVDQAIVSAAGRSVEAFDYRGAGPSAFLELPPGGHDIEVQVAWDGGERTERIWGRFESGTTRRLRARHGGFILKSLSLDWE
ncbi:MAG TPA: serine/threonine-protein kinase [Vicinamibacteria bacterium]|nr:serine/threonine-protein kinase [Vicinamibacteria bacterium]